MAGGLGQTILKGSVKPDSMLRAWTLPPRATMSMPAMEFLLVLSALLSALTGAFTGPRDGEARLGHAQAQLIAAAEVGTPVRTAALRPVQALPSIVLLSSHAPEIAPAPALLAPLAFIRLIE
jgi:hypothetical protein